MHLPVMNKNLLTTKITVTLKHLNRSTNIEVEPYKKIKITSKIKVYLNSDDTFKISYLAYRSLLTGTTDMLKAFLPFGLSIFLIEKD